MATLPPDVIGEIYNHLAYSDISKIASVSSQFASVAQNWHYWKQRCHREFDFPPDLFDTFDSYDSRFVYRMVRRMQEVPDTDLLLAVQERKPPLVVYIMTHLKPLSLTGAISTAITQDDLQLIAYLLETSLPRMREETELIYFGRLLYLAGQYRQMMIVQYLYTFVIKHDLMLQDDALSDILDGASASGDIAIARYAIRRGATNFKVPFEIACIKGHLNLCQYYVDNGQTEFTTPIQFAIHHGHLNIVKFLVEHNNSDLTLSALRISLQLARSLGYHDIIEYLEQRGVTV